MTPKEMALLLVRALDSKKGQDILLLETDGLTTLSDYFVLCTGTSAPQLKALADAAERSMKENDILPHHVEGHRGGTWILQDYGDVVLHLSPQKPGSFMTWTACGRTPRRWISAMCLPGVSSGYHNNND